MKILHLIASPVFSGPAENVLQVALAQRALGHEVRVAIDRKRPGLASEEPGAPLFESARLLDEGGLELSTQSSPVRMLRDIARLRGRSLDVVHAHSSHDHWVARWGRPRGAKLVRSIHAPRSLRWSLPYADAFTVPFADLIPRLAGRSTQVFPALVSEQFVPPADRGALRASLMLTGNPLIGMVSTFQPSRRHALALEAFALVSGVHPSARFVLIGDGVLEARLHRLCEALGVVPSVTFLGYRSGADFVRCLQALDEVWILGLGSDWSGRAAAQARACGVRVVATQEGALPELADAVVSELTPQAVRNASLGGARAVRPLSRPEEVARHLLVLYGTPRT